MKTRLRLNNPTQIRKTLSRISNMVINLEIDTKIANTIILACNAILGSIRVDEQQKRIDEIEEYIERQKKK